MNKIFRLIGVLLTLSVLLVVLVIPAAAAEKTVYQCNETTVGVLDPGTAFLSDGGILHIRGMVMLLRDEADTPLMTGNNTIVLNANWDAAENGPMWGTAHFETDEGGVWEGTWAGQITAQGAWENASMTGYGKYAGMKARWNKTVSGCTVTILKL